MKLLVGMFKRKTLISFTCSSRDIGTIKRYLVDGFKVVFMGVLAVLTKVVVL